MRLIIIFSILFTIVLVHASSSIGVNHDPLAEITVCFSDQSQGYSLDAPNRRLLQLAGGNGARVNMPPHSMGQFRRRVISMLGWAWLGFNQHSLDYMFRQQHTGCGNAVSLVGYSFVFALVYVVARFILRLWFGAWYGILITVAMHGFDSAIRFPQSSYAPGGRLDVEPERF